jgi:hypothetical protein
MSSESVYQVARSWVDVGNFHKRLVVKFKIFTASVRNILDNSSYILYVTLYKEEIAAFYFPVSRSTIHVFRSAEPLLNFVAEVLHDFRKF